VESTPSAGLYETLLTARVQQLLHQLPEDQLVADLANLVNAEASDRVSRHISHLLAQAIEAIPESHRAQSAVQLATDVLGHLQTLVGSSVDLLSEVPLDSGQVLQAILRRRPDGTPDILERPLTPLLDTTVLTSAPGEPAVAHEVRAEVPSADRVDVLMAFIRWSGVRALLEALRRHCQFGKPLRVLTTTYTNSSGHLMSWLLSARRFESPTTPHLPDFMPKLGSSTDRVAIRPPTSAPRTSPTRRK
jgi:hypothetical protein